MSKFEKLTTKEKTEYIAAIALYPLMQLFSILGKTFKLFGTKKRQITASVLSFCIILGMIPIMSLTAFAAPTTDITSWAGLQNVLDNASTNYTKPTQITMAKSLTAGDDDSQLEVAEDTYVELNLHGYTLNRNLAMPNNDGTVIYNEGTLIISDSVGTGKITGGKTMKYGGGICNVDGGILTINGGSITGNEAKRGGGGGIYNDGNSILTINGGSITDNEATDSGGGIYVGNNILNITGGTITGNKASCGGGIYNCDTISISGGSITGNTATDSGGGILNAKTLTISNGSITGNTCDQFGGGVYCFLGTMSISGSVSITGNVKGGTITDGTLIGGTAENVYLKDSNTLTINSELTGTVGVTSSRTTYPDTIATGAYAATANIVSDVDTLYVATNGNNLTLTNMKLITSWADLQAKFDSASTDENNPTKITLSQNLKADNNDKELTVVGDTYVELDLASYTLDANKKFNVILNHGGNLTISDSSTNGTGKITGGYSGDDNYSEYASLYGGGISNYGHLTITGGAITGNTADYNAGGIINYGHLTITGGSITGNTAASNGGGISNNAGIMTVTGGTITGNAATNGGGIYNDGTFTLSGSASITGNTGAENEANNVYLTIDNTFSINGAFTGTMGVTKKATSYPVTITQVSDSYTIKDSDVKKLKSDVDGLEIELSGSNAVLKKIPGTLTADNFTFVAPNDLTYTGTAKTANVTAKTDVDCGAITVKYYDASGNKFNFLPKNVNTYTVKIDVAANDNYKAATDLEVGAFTITPKAIDSSNITISGINDYYLFTGSAITPRTTVKIGNTMLTRNTDYNVSYENNTQIGTNAKVNVTLKGNYSGSAEKTFEIRYGTMNDTEIKNAITLPEFNSNGWYKKNIDINATSGWTLSTTPTGTFESSLTISKESAKTGTDYTFYIKADDGSVYQRTLTYKLDKTNPTDIKVQYKNNGFKSFLNTITFGLFFKENVQVTAQATDELSGIAKYQYAASDTKDSSGVTWQNSLFLQPNSK